MLLNRQEMGSGEEKDVGGGGRGERGEGIGEVGECCKKTRETEKLIRERITELKGRKLWLLRTHSVVRRRENLEH